MALSSVIVIVMVGMVVVMMMAMLIVMMTSDGDGDAGMCSKLGGAYHRHGDKYVIKLLASVLGVWGKWGRESV